MPETIDFQSGRTERLIGGAVTPIIAAMTSKTVFDSDIFTAITGDAAFVDEVIKLLRRDR